MTRRSGCEGDESARNSSMILTETVLPLTRPGVRAHLRSAVVVPPKVKEVSQTTAL
jgi:hypothetical protein